MHSATDAIRGTHEDNKQVPPQSQNPPNRDPLKATPGRRFRQYCLPAGLKERLFARIVRLAVRYLRLATKRLESLEAQLERHTTSQKNLRAMLEFRGGAWQDTLDEGRAEPRNRMDRRQP